MADENASDAQSNGALKQENEDQKKGSIQVAAQYIRDLSFECPNTELLLSGGDSKPDLSVEINVNAQNLPNNLYESSIEFTANTSISEGAIYDLEIVYTGIFKLENISKEALEPVLLVNCPTLLFPFMRRIVADLTRENGFPPLFLEPIDFATLYLQRKQQKSDE